MNLRALEINFVRGASAPFVLPFSTGKRLTIIYGENGNGKTTICDGLELLGKGSISSLDDRGLGQTARYEHTIGHSRDDMVVRLTTSDGTCVATVTRSTVKVDRPELRPTVAILRRASMLKLLEADPAKRYEAIKDFIDVDRVQRAEDALRKALKNVEIELNSAVSQVQGNLDILVGFWMTAGQPGVSALEWAKGRATSDPELLHTQLALLRAVRATFRDLTPFVAKHQNAVASTQTAGQAAQDAAEAYQQALERVEAGAEAMMDILSAAEEYLAPQKEVPTCPLCTSAEKAKDLKAAVTSRLEALGTLRASRAARDKSARAAQVAERDLERINTAYSKAREAFALAYAQPTWQSDASVASTLAPETLSALADWLASTREVADNWENEEVELTSALSLQAGLSSYFENASAVGRLQREQGGLQQMLDVIGQQRRAIIDGILRGIAKEVGALYEMVHPGEGLSKITLQLDQARRSSLQIEATFGEHDGVPPMAYFSQSHLDTLGLCIFVALARRGAPRKTILVLDDVITSVDEPHVDRVIGMLYSQAQHFQHCIFTTHYGPWRQKYRWGFLKTGDCAFVELGRWTLDDGITLIGAVPELERLRRLLSDSTPDVQAACSKAGVVLEAVLNFLTLQYQCAVPRKHDGSYALGDLLPSITKKLKEALAIEIISADASGARVAQKRIMLEPVLSELDKIRNVRNLSGAHFNALSFELLDTDALRFAQLVFDLASAVIDEEHGWPKSDKSGSYWSNSGDTRRLHPLKKPS